MSKRLADTELCQECTKKLRLFADRSPLVEEINQLSRLVVDRFRDGLALTDRPIVLSVWDRNYETLTDYGYWPATPDLGLLVLCTLECLCENNSDESLSDVINTILARHHGYELDADQVLLLEKYFGGTELGRFARLTDSRDERTNSVYHYKLTLVTQEEDQALPSLAGAVFIHSLPALLFRVSYETD